VRDEGSVVVVGGWVGRREPGLRNTVSGWLLLRCDDLGGVLYFIFAGRVEGFGGVGG